MAGRADWVSAVSADMTDGSDVMLGYIHPGVVDEHFHKSVLALVRRHPSLGVASTWCAGGAVARCRDQIARTFLSRPGRSWLFWVDTDMGFEAGALDMLLDTADPKTHPAVGGLAFRHVTTGHGPYGNLVRDKHPVIYRLLDGEYQMMDDYPRDSVVECDATGSAFLLVHRSVLQQVAESYPTIYANQADESGFRGEDVVFCERVRKLGYPIYVDTRVRTAHRKTCYLVED